MILRPIYSTYYTRITGVTDYLEYSVYSVDITTSAATLIAEDEAFPFPSNDYVDIDLRPYARQILDSTIVGFSGESVEYGTSYVCLRLVASGTTYEDILFFNNWSYENATGFYTGGTLSAPVNGHATPSMYIPYTSFEESASSICYEIMPAIEAYFEVSPTAITGSYSGFSRTVTIISNIPWVASTDDSHVTLSQYAGGSGSTEITITLAANTGISAYTGTVSLTITDIHGTHVIPIEITQPALTYPTMNYITISGYPNTPRLSKYNVLSNTYDENGCHLLYKEGYHIEPQDFSGYTDIRYFSLNEEMSMIGNRSFMNCTNLEGADLGPSIQTIPWRSFEGCTALSSVTLHNGVTTIEDNAFKGCTALSGITIPDTVTTLGTGVFRHCTALSDITIPDSVTTLGAAVFSGCTALTSITIPDTVTTLGDHVFYGCTNLVSVTLPSGLTGITVGMFVGCTSLTEINIPDSVTEISQSAFEGCTALTSITIPSSVTSMSYSAFEDCSALTELYCYATTAPTIKYTAFKEIGQNGTLHYPAGADYSAWLSSSPYYLGYYGWTGVADL